MRDTVAAIKLHKSFIACHSGEEGDVMTKVMINPGICGFITSAEAVSDDDSEVKVKVKSGVSQREKDV